MTRVRIIRDLVFPVADGTHTIQRGTYFYVYGNTGVVTNEGAYIDIGNGPHGNRQQVLLFVGQDIEIVADPLPF